MPIRMNYVTPSDRRQTALFTSLEEMIHPDNPVRVIDALVDAVVSAHRARFTPPRTTDVGRPAYHPATLLKLYLYGYFNGISSTRKLEIETHRNLEVRWLLGALTPDFWTIAAYRRTHGEDIIFLTTQVRQFLAKRAYIAGHRMAIDGTKVKANASRDDVVSLTQMQEQLRDCEAHVARYLEQLQREDAREEHVGAQDETHRRDPDDPPGGGDAQATAAEKQLADAHATIARLKEEIRSMQRTGRKYRSTTDPDARLQHTTRGNIVGYNVQVAVDAKHHMIADSTVVDAGADQTVLEEVLDSVVEEIGRVPTEVLADGGYYDPDSIERVESKYKTAVYVPIPEQTPSAVTFTFDPTREEYRCSEGRRLTLRARNRKKGDAVMDQYQGIECDGCPIRSVCTTSPRGRIVYRYHNQEWRDAYKSRMAEPEAQAVRSRRKTIIEHTFGTIKYLMGSIPLLVRGQRGVSTEIALYTLAYNLRRLITLRTTPSLVQEISKHGWIPV